MREPGILVVQGWQTKQQGDIDRLTYVAQTAALQVAQVNVKAQQAAVARLEELTGFERVTAPFSGIITRRQIDVGNLVTADVSSGTPMFAIDRTDVLRVLVYVPQDYVFGLKDGEGRCHRPGSAGPDLQGQGCAQRQLPRSRDPHAPGRGRCRQ
jgi:Membrane-fusion protein